MYDLIGDIHGSAKTLRGLLEKLGYREDGNSYRHPQRQVIFLGDFIDRGPHQRETIAIARAMTTHGAALAVMGNHEFNAISYATPDPANPSQFLRPHNDKNDLQHAAFLQAFAGDDAGKADALAWFRTLPLWLDLGSLRVIHACWDPRLMGTLAPLLGTGNTLTDVLLLRASRRLSPEYDALETLLKGKEVRLPDGLHFYDKGNLLRHHVRIKWWERDGTFRSLSLGADSRETHIQDEPLDTVHLITYGHDEPPVFIGHYWLKGTPAHPVNRTPVRVAA